MEWIKQGLIFDPELYPRDSYLKSHAANPLPIHKYGSIFRIFYSGRDIGNRSSIGYFDYDFDANSIVEVGPSASLIYGQKGTFYQDGISLGCSYKHEGSTYILFMGWQNPTNEHWRGDIGRIKLTADYELEVCSETPILELSDEDPISFSYPCAFESEEGMHIIYGSTLEWEESDREMIHVFKQAVSKDKIHWIPTGLAVPFKLNYAQAFSRPTILIGELGDQHLWFSYRSGNGQAYRIGYAYRKNISCNWELKLEEAGISVSPTGWDSQMIEYPYVFRHKHQVLMLYNGNGFGKTGIGVARLKNDRL